MLEITDVDTWNETLNVKRQFRDYREKGIPIESYLAHDLDMTGPSAVMEVKNDLIICSPDMSSSTTLQFNNLSRMNLYDGNTITDREGHTISLGSGASIGAGETDTDDSGNYPATTIQHLAYALLIIQAGPKLLPKKGLCI